MPLRALLAGDPTTQPCSKEPTMTVFIRAAAIRAARTAAQTAIAAIGATVLITEVDWALIGSMTGMATLLSALNSVVTGLPEVPSDDA